MTGELEGKVCVVTGGSRGIGLAICEAFAAQGGSVVIVDLDPAVGEGAAAALRDAGATAAFYRMDVTDQAEVAAVADQVLRDLGAVHVLVNNAGISRLGPSMDFALRDWQDTMDVLVTGVFLCSQSFGRAMRDSGGGSIVNISSLNGIVNFPMRLAYSAAKAAVISMTKVLAVEWCAYGIRVNAVAPGMIETAMLRQVVDEGLIDVDAYLARMPLGRFGRPDEVAQTVLHLATDRSSYTTGQLLVTDGGFTTFDWIDWSGDPDNPGIAKAGAPG